MRRLYAEELSKISKIIPRELFGNIADSSIEDTIKDHLRQYFIDGEAKEDRLLLLKSFYGLAKNDIDFLGENLFEFNQKTFNEDVEIFLQVYLSKRQVIEKVIKKIKELILIDFKNEIKEIADKNISFILLKMAKVADKYGISLPWSLQIFPVFNIIRALNSFFEEYPLEGAEKLITKGRYKKETDVGWEIFKETLSFEKEKRMIIKEKMTEIFFYYAEKYEEIRPMLKSLK